MENLRPKVTIICTTYNHELFIKDCLEGFLMQKTDFPFEIIIHDDASTDNTQEIIREYAKKYPHMIRAILQEENQLSKGMRITKEFILPYIRGEYVALCEGDDYWISDEKLQKQVDALEDNTTCKMCVSKVKRVNQEGKFLYWIPNNQLIQEGIIDGNKFVELALTSYSFQTSGYFFRTNDYINYYKESPRFFEVAPVGDVPLMLYFGYTGDIYYIDEPLSAYRENKISSWNYTIKNTKRVEIREKKRKMYKEYDQYTKGMFHDLCEFSAIRSDYLSYIEERKYEKIAKEPYLVLLNKEGIRFRLKVKAYAFVKNRIKK